jgi:hypothetical protein
VQQGLRAVGQYAPRRQHSLARLAEMQTLGDAIDEQIQHFELGQVAPGKAVVREGKVFCSQACAYECTETTCVCVHDRCEDETKKH